MTLPLREREPIDRDDLGFFQAGPRLSNTFDADPALSERLERLLPGELAERLRPAWQALGEAAAGPLLELARQAEAEPPRHVPYDAWGRRVDEVRCSPAWTELHAQAAHWGLTAIPYEGRLGSYARLHQFALLLLYAPSSAIYSCPLAMTDGAARTLLEHADDALKQRVVPRLTSRDPRQLWTSGQWMTERTGGSDVSESETVAVLQPDGSFELHGCKWFTSSVDSQVALTLARTEEAEGGSAGLSLFLVEVRRPDGSLNGLRVRRLKDKLGTRALPTAELTLEGCLAEPVGALGHGVRKITPLLNLTRLHNSINACGFMTRLLQLQRDWASRREAFGRRLRDLPLHRETLADLQVEYEAALSLTLDAARLLGRQESGEAPRSERLLLRLLTPLCKALTGKQAVAVASESLEAFGGPGYVEDTGLPVHLRDAQVLPIWEGTTNVLSLDALRALTKDGALQVFLEAGYLRAESLSRGPLVEQSRRLEQHLQEVEHGLPALLAAGPEVAQATARRLALKLAGVAAALPLLEQGEWALVNGRGERAALAARRWVQGRIPSLPDAREAQARLGASAVLAGFED